MYKIEMLDMRKVRNWILLSLTLLLSCNRDAVYTVSIQGELEGVKYGTAYLRTFGGERFLSTFFCDRERSICVRRSVAGERSLYVTDQQESVISFPRWRENTVKG